MLSRVLVLLLPVAAVLAGCSSAQSLPEPLSAAVPTEFADGYVQAARELGAAELTDEQLLAAGRFLCERYGNMTKRPYADQAAAYGALDDEGLVPVDVSNETLRALLNATPFLCLNG